ncbi:MAG: hypothetical protein JJU40_02315 [Rhodobacteraceae bacterium]|nr:hypothetical protein [Paracoccaceae bacterium]
MSLLMMRGPLLAQGSAVTGPPVTPGAPWLLDASRTPLGYTLSEDQQSVVNSSGGPDNRRWVPTARAILPSDGPRYWEVLCAPGGASPMEGHLGLVPAPERDAFDAGTDPVTRGAIGYRGDGTLWSSDSDTPLQRRAGLAPFGAGDVVMFLLHPAHASLWIGVNGAWQDDPASGAPSWTTAPSPAFHPVIQGRNPGDGGTLRSLPAQFSYPLPPGAQPLAQAEPHLRLFQAGAFVELGWDRDLSIAGLEAWRDLGGGARLTSGSVALLVDLGGGPALSAAHAALYIELDPS